MVNLNKSIEKSSSQVVREMCIKGVWKHSDINANDEIGLDVAVRHKWFVMETYSELLKRPRRFSDMGDLFWQLVAYSDQCATLHGKKRGHRKHFERVISPLALEHPATTASSPTFNAGSNALHSQKRSLSSEKMSAKKPKHALSKKSKYSFKPAFGVIREENEEHEQEKAVILGSNNDYRHPSPVSGSNSADSE